MKLIIYMPAFNEEKSIQHVISNLPRELENIKIVQYLVIDDGSTDKTATLAQSSGAHVVMHSRNRGVGAALHSAVQFALENEADILVGIDADGQFDPAEIPVLIEPIITKKADMVIGNRFVNGIPEYMPPIRYWGNKKVAQLISNVSGHVFQDVSCGFRAYSREALFRLNIFGEFTYTHESILSLTYQGLQVVEYPIKVKYDPERKSRVAASILSSNQQDHFSCYVRLPPNAGAWGNSRDASSHWDGVCFVLIWPLCSNSNFYTIQVLRFYWPGFFDIWYVGVLNCPYCRYDQPTKDKPRQAFV
jgi:glycosyltransferase involved in cell wall biosynthesis